MLCPYARTHPGGRPAGEAGHGTSAFKCPRQWPCVGVWGGGGLLWSLVTELAAHARSLKAGGEGGSPKPEAQPAEVRARARGPRRQPPEQHAGSC